MKQGARWLISNLPLMVMALILAVLAWFVAVEQANPTVQRRYAQSVPVQVAGLPEDLVVVGTFEERVHVTVRTTQSVWDSLRVEDFAAVADVSGLGAGTHEVQVEVDLGKEPSRIIEVEPQVVTIELDAKASEVVRVRIDTEGRPAVGYVVRTQTVEPREVTVTGPRSYVTQVVDVYGSLSIQGAEADVEEALTVQPRDEQGNSVPHVALTPERVDVRLPIEPSGYHATLAVRAVLTGEVASGYRITDIAINPPTVTVFGNPDDLEALEQGFIETKPVVVEGADEDVVVRPGLSTPASVSLVPGEQVEVHVFIDAIQSSLTITSTPEIQGLEPGYTATVSPDTVQVILSGPLPKLEALTSNDVRVILDLFELQVGTHQIEPEVVVPEAIEPQGVIPTTVQVRIAEATEVTPTPGRSGSTTSSGRTLET
ncbi:MAG: CdaR family protein [Chloroflexota bacterium]|nr:CdaR family protein [Chloroflexota bacterium]